MENNNKNFIKSFDFEAAYLPHFEEVVNNKDWVYWGDDNLWPSHSIDLYNYSSILRSALNSIRDAVIGKEMLIDGKPANLFMANSTESVYDVFKKVSTDYVIHNGFTLNTIKRRDGEGVSEFYHMDLSKVRAGKADEVDRVKEYYFSNNWANIRKYKPVELPAFDLRDDSHSQIYFFKTYQPSQFYYPVNEWVASSPGAEIHLNESERRFNSHV